MKAGFIEQGVPSDSPGTNDQELSSPADIQRPRSALHSGDFREGARQDSQSLPQSPLHGQDTGSRFPLLGSSPTAPWFTAPIFASPSRTQSTTISVSDENGQLQVMIKNPNKTAVKLFLIPYDLSDMEPGSKTFIRQRSYSAGPVIDMPLTARKNYGTDRPEVSLNSSEDPKDKPILRYLIHLNICCPSKGRFYLHSSIRVVFANRVPDGKERLRNEIQHPEPRYAPYKPARDVNQTQLNTKLVTDGGCRRSAADQGSIPASLPYLASPCGQEGQPATPIPAIEAQTVSSNLKDARSGQRAPHPFRPIPSLREEVLPLHDYDAAEPYQTGSGTYSKLTKGDLGYGGYPFSPMGGSEAGESLLAKRLRGLDVQKHNSSGIN
ncbi:hypothetical protein APSETT444_002717 [Aspergillus pseudonomiae]